MSKIKLYSKTSHSTFHTLAGVGIAIDLLYQAAKETGADPNTIVLRFHDGSHGVSMDVMFPTPHTYLFDGILVKEGKLCFHLGKLNCHNRWQKCQCKNKYELPLANPEVVKDLSELILKRAKSHRKTKSALK